MGGGGGGCAACVRACICGKVVVYECPCVRVVGRYIRRWGE